MQYTLTQRTTMDDVYLLPSPLPYPTHAQVQILSRIKHPYIISMVAVTLRPKAMLFLEFAELGSLASLYPYSNLSNTLKHRIAFQVSSSSLASAHTYVPNLLSLLYKFTTCTWPTTTGRAIIIVNPRRYTL